MSKSPLEHLTTTSKRGDVFTAEQLNAIKSIIRQYRPIGGPGITARETKDGTVLSTPVENWYFAYTPATGIAPRTGTPPGELVPGSAEAQIYMWTGSTLKIQGPDRTVMNWTTKTIPGSRLIRVVPRWQLWWVVNTDCP